MNDRIIDNIDKNRSKRISNSMLVNSLLLVSGLVMIFSGLVLQLGFHMGRSGGHEIRAHEVQSLSIPYEQLREIDTDKIVCGFNYSTWSDMHKFVIVFFSLFMLYHAYVHWKWYKGVIIKRLISKNRQVILLSVFFLFVAVTGFIPWFIDLSGSTSILRLFFIEIHDKVALILIVFLILHMVKKAKWFAIAYAKLKK